MTDETDGTRRALLWGAAAGMAAYPLAFAAAQDAGGTPGAVALITGTSSGFGRLTALAMARTGFRTFASMRRVAGRNAAAADDLRRVAAAEALPLDVVEIDVTDVAAIDAGVASVLERAGRIDVLVNNAGLGIPGPVELSAAAMRTVIETNFFGPFHLARAALPAMRAQGSGLIVQVTSGLGRFVMPTLGSYCASKLALEALSEALAYELAPLGVDVAIVQPGAYDTEFNENARAAMAAMLDGLSEADKARLADYGAHMAVARGVVAEADTPPGDAVAEAILGLARMAPGARPLRTVLGAGGGGTRALNERLAETQRGVLRGMGLADWYPDAG